MLLNRILGRLRRDDDGVAMITVIGVTAVGVILSSIILSSLVSGIAFTSATRAGVQSQADADAGLAAVQAGLQKSGDCVAKGGLYTSGVSGLQYRATTWIMSGSTWIRGCPASASAPVRVISEGLASQKGVAGNAGGDRSYVEAVFGAVVSPIVNGPSAAAVFVASGGSASNLNIGSGTGSPGDIHILKGDFNCNSVTTVQGSLIVAEGSANLNSACTILGSVKASVDVLISSSATIGQDVVAGGNVTLSNSSNTVGGNVYANGNALEIHGRVDGSVAVRGFAKVFASGWIKKDLSAGGQLFLQGRVDRNVTTPSTTVMYVQTGALRVGGNLTIGGPITTTNMTPTAAESAAAAAALTSGSPRAVVGTLQYNRSGLIAPAPLTPATVTPWVDFVYKPADWSASFTIVPWVGACSLGSWNTTGHVTYEKIKNATTPLLVDATSCDELATWDVAFPIKTDVVIIFKKAHFGKTTFSSANGAEHNLWFLKSDGNAANSGKDCPNASEAFVTDNSTTISTGIVALVYTPCSVDLTGTTKWRGQIYSGTLSVGSGDTLVYFPLGIPGTDLSGGTTPGGGGAGVPKLGDPITIRNRTNNGEISP